MELHPNIIKFIIKSFDTTELYDYGDGYKMRLGKKLTKKKVNQLWNRYKISESYKKANDGKHCADCGGNIGFGSVQCEKCYDKWKDKQEEYKCIKQIV